MKHVITVALAAAAMLTAPVGHADPDPHKPDPGKHFCPGGGTVDQMSPLEPSCDGVPYDDGAYWRAINRGAPGTASLVVVQCVKPPPPPGLLVRRSPCPYRRRRAAASQDAPLAADMQTFLKDCRWGRFLLLRGDMISTYADVYGEWSELEVSLYRRLLKTDSVVVEVGANLGLHTVPLAKIASSGRVICFEPRRAILQHPLRQSGAQQSRQRRRSSSGGR